VFFSKIVYFLIAAAAAVAMTLALVIPRPADRDHAIAEHERLAVACGVVNILFKDHARTRTALAQTFSRSQDLIGRVADAGGASEIDQSRMLAARKAAQDLIAKVEDRRPGDAAGGAQARPEDQFSLKPDFAILIDRKGRVVARAIVGEDDYGDVVAGRPLIDDALAGYVRDDLWLVDGRLYLVAASPVISANGTEYVGAVVLGHAVTTALAKRLTAGLDVGVAIYTGDKPVASTSATPLDREALDKAVASLKGGMIDKDCAANQPFNLRAGDEQLAGVVARLPGEAQRDRAYFAIFITRPEVFGFAGRLGKVTKGDLSFGNFPWLLVGGGFVLALLLGLAAMVVEADRPLRRLAVEAVRLAKGEIERFDDQRHRGKFGSIARSVNIHIDKLGRDAKNAKQDFDNLLGPPSEGSLGAINIDLLGSRAAAGAPPATPPPSEFRFGGSSPRLAAPAASSGLDLGSGRGPAVAARSTPPPVARPAGAAPGMPPRAPTPPPMPSRSVDDDPFGPRDVSADPSGVGTPGALGASGEEHPYFRQVFDQFVTLKRRCNEPTAGLTFARFSDKLRRNREELMQKTGCKEVRFTVYVKDGKAALKATPVRDGEAM
jgi:hypothetical protein